MWVQVGHKLWYYFNEGLWRSAMAEFQQYRKKQVAEMRPYVKGEAMKEITISDEDERGGSPKLGDMIARNPKNHDDQWLVSEKFFNDNYEAVNPPAVTLKKQ